MKTLITGGGGFLGRFVARRLKKAGYDVTVLGRNKYPFLEKEGFETIQADIFDREKLLKVFKGFDEIHHVASLAGINVNIKPFYKINVIGTQNVIDACLSNGIKKLIYTSSPSVVYENDNLNMANEELDYPDNFLSCYAETKALAEKKVLEANSRDFLTVSLRPHLIWGPEDTNLIPRLIERASKGRLFIVGSGLNEVDVTYVENVAFAHLLASQKLIPGSSICGQAYFITNDEPLKLWEFVNKILKGVSLNPVSRKIPFLKMYWLGYVLEKLYVLLKIDKEPMMTRFLASQLAYTHTYSIEKAKKDLGYKPEISVDEGLKRLISYLTATNVV